MSAALVALMLSRSLTGAMTVVAAVMAGLIVAGLRPRRGSSADAAMLVGVVVLAMAVVAIGISWLYWRDPTLTGRTMIWDESWKFIKERPILGYGYGAFWNEASGPMAILQQAIGWPAPNAHNGYVDLWLQLGLLGICLFAAALLQALWPLLKRIRFGDGAGVYATALIGSGLLCRELAESSLLGQNDFGWLVLVMVLSSVDRIQQRRRPVTLASN
jgi:exopolysaccharide production protein ExoQ